MPDNVRRNPLADVFEGWLLPPSSSPPDRRSRSRTDTNPFQAVVEFHRETVSGVGYFNGPGHPSPLGDDAGSDDNPDTNDGEEHEHDEALHDVGQRPTDEEEAAAREVYQINELPSTQTPESDTLSPQDKKILRQAWVLLRQGRSTESCLKTSEHAMRQTPPEMARHDITLKPYQLSAAGKIVKIVTGPRTKNPDGTLGTLKGALLGFDMGLGKTYTSIAVALECKRRFPEELVMVVVPVSLVAQWLADMRKFMSDFVVLTYVTPLPPPESVDFSKIDVLLTTYEVVRRQYGIHTETQKAWRAMHHGNGEPDLPPGRPCPLLNIEPALLIADESGRMGNSDSQTTKAMSAVRAHKKLALSGTPLTSDYTNLQALAAFLDIPPWNNMTTFRSYFISKKTEAAKAATLRPMRNAILAVTLRAFYLPLNQSDNFDGAPVVDLPKATKITIKHVLDAEEQSYQKETRALWDPEYREELKESGMGSGLVDAQVLRAMTMARMALVHKSCVRYGYARDEENGVDAVESHRLDAKASKRREEHRAMIRNDWHSSRVDKFMELLQKRLSDPTRGKVLVFDEFLCTLDVVEAALKAHGIPFRRYDGSMSAKERTETEKRFQDPATERVLLITIQSGAVGLNLTAADTVFILTPRYNPSVDEQAGKRAHRIGQKKPVEIIRFFTKESIEARVEEIRKVKLLKAKKVLSPRHLPKVTMREIQSWTYETFAANLTKIRSEPAHEDDGVIDHDDEGEDEA